MLNKLNRKEKKKELNLKKKLLLLNNDLMNGILKSHVINVNL